VEFLYYIHFISFISSLGEVLIYFLSLHSMRRVIRLSAYLIVFLSLWLTALNDIPYPLKEPWKGIIQLLPLFALISFGCYSLGVISYNLMTFPECPEEAKSLEKERERAVEDLKKKGLDVFK